jgi:ribulose kinase
MKPMDDRTLNMMNGKPDIIFRCSHNHALWQPFDIHNGFYNWSSVAMTRDECSIVCRWLSRKREELLLQPDFIRSVNNLNLRGEHKVMLFLKMKGRDTKDIAEATCTSEANVKKVLSRTAQAGGYDGTPALINALKMRLYYPWL